MMNSIRSEASKLWTLRSFRAIAAAAIAYPLVGLVAAISVPASEQPAPDGQIVLDSLKSGAQMAGFLVLVLGILFAAGEYRHATIVPSLLANPRRARFFVAKLATVTVVGAVIGVASSIVSISVAAAYLGSEGVSIAVLPTSDLLLAAAGAVLATALYGAVGTGIGGLMRNQTAAIAGALVWLFAVEEIIPIVLRDPGLRQWLPGGAAAQLTQLATPSPELLAGWAAAVALIAVALGVGWAAIAGTTRADL